MTRGGSREPCDTPGLARTDRRVIDGANGVLGDATAAASNASEVQENDASSRLGRGSQETHLDKREGLQNSDAT